MHGLHRLLSPDCPTPPDQLYAPCMSSAYAYHTPGYEERLQRCYKELRPLSSVSRCAVNDTHRELREFAVYSCVTDRLFEAALPPVRSEHLSTGMNQEL